MNNLPKTASEAKALGIASYYTGRINSCGHDAPRWAISKRCTVCQPMDRSPEYTRRMRAAFEAAYTKTLHSGYLHVPWQDLEGDWWLMPVRDGQGDGLDDDPTIEPICLEGGRGNS
ncbi:hypothetical protein [Roseinatronobacter sp. S2]|uniref:hypothetical protein n=1 Tax=Roseinatronobacter sp. S2 TaxID=3035471 RepID=UPI00241023BA|nr:hypothetical protein [Roseinatronobacter sp. S2]WFE74257.1 hypothetical protein P8S53_13855 [Roseinatronobacter sp. S2]